MIRAFHIEWHDEKEQEEIKESDEAAWQRIFEKFDHTKEYTMSPFGKKQLCYDGGRIFSRKEPIMDSSLVTKGLRIRTGTLKEKPIHLVSPDRLKNRQSNMLAKVLYKVPTHDGDTLWFVEHLDDRQISTYWASEFEPEQ